MKILSIIVIITIFWDSEFAFGLVLPNGYHHINRKILIDGGTDSPAGYVTYGEDCTFTRISASQVVTAAGCKTEFFCKTSRRRKKRQDEPATDAPAEGGDGAESSAESNADTESSSPEAAEAGASEEPVEGVEEGGGGGGEEPDEGVEPGDGGEPEGEVQPEYEHGEGEVGQEVGQEGAGEVEGGDVGGGGAVEEGGGYGEAEQIPEEKAAAACNDKVTPTGPTEKNGLTILTADGAFSGDIIGDDKLESCKAVGFGDKEAGGLQEKKLEIDVKVAPADGDDLKVTATTPALCGGDSGGAIVCGGKLAGILKKLPPACAAEAAAVKVSVLTSNSTSDGGGSSEATQHLISPLMVITLVSATIGIMFTN